MTLLDEAVVKCNIKMTTSLSNDTPRSECCNPKKHKVPWVCMNGRGWSWKVQYSELRKAGEWGWIVALCKCREVRKFMF